MSRVYLLAEGDEIARRRGLVPRGQVIEAWPDLHARGASWVGEGSKALIDAVGPPLPPKLAVPADLVAVFYGPQLCDLESLPREDTLKARVLSVHGIAVAWITLDRFGERTTYEPQSLADPVFYLRSIGAGSVHVWRWFSSRRDAVAYMRESYGPGSEGHAWAEGLPVEDYESLLQRALS